MAIRPGLLWEGDPFKSGYWAAAPGEAGDSHVIPEHDTIEHVRSRRCICSPVLTWCEPGWMWTHHAFDRRDVLALEVTRGRLRA